MNNILWFLILINIVNKNLLSCDKSHYYDMTSETSMKNFNNQKDLENSQKSHINDLLSYNNMSIVKIAGLRLEPTKIEVTGVNGYSDEGISIVQPDTEVKIVIFGDNLQKIDYVGFTIDENCNNMKINVSKNNFISLTNQKLTFIGVFLHKKSIYKLCYHLTTDFNIYRLNENKDTNISTMFRPKKYIMPFWIQLSVIILFTMLSGLFSGLNLGLMTLTPQELELICNSGTEQDKKYAKAIMPIRQSGNFLLCSLLIGNVLINSAISILMDDLTSGLIALIASSAGIVIFGEIIPQSFCVKKGLAVGAKTIWITRFFMVLTFPIAYPMSKLLDLVIGVEVVAYDRKKLMELIKMTVKDESAMEFKIAFGAMEIADKTVKDVMTKIHDVFMLSETTILNPQKVTEIVNMGYTRIPVYANNDRNNVVSLLFIKDLALIDPDVNFTVKDVCDYNQHVLRFVLEDTPLKAMLEEFKKGDYHLAIVKRKKTEDINNKQNELCGLVTLEDILEEILKAEIIDETDVVMDNVHKIKRKTRNNKYLSTPHRNNFNKKSSKNKIILPKP